MNKSIDKQIYLFLEPPKKKAVQGVLNGFDYLIQEVDLLDLVHSTDHDLEGVIIADIDNIKKHNISISQLKQNNEFLLILGIISEHDIDTIQWLYEIGINDYLQTPLLKIELLTKLENLLNFNQRNRESSLSKVITNTLVNNLSQGLLIIDLDLKIQEINEPALKLLDFPKELKKRTIIGRSITDLLSNTSEHAQLLKAFHDGISNESPYNVNLVLKTSRQIFHVQISAFRAQEVTTFFIKDLEQIYQHTKQLKRLSAIATKAEEAAASGSWSLDLLSGKITWSKNLYKIHGINEVDFDQTVAGVLNFVHPKDQDFVKTTFDKFGSGSQILEFEYRVITPAGVVKNMKASCNFTQDENREYLEIYGMLQDVTKGYTTEQELIRLKNKAEESDRLKSAFLANMSHEIRTPLNAIMGYSQLMLSEIQHNAKLKSYLDIVLNSGENLLNLINDIIDIAKIESGQLTISNVQCHVKNLVENTVNSFQPSVHKGEINLRFIVNAEFENLVVETDKLRLSQILSNLINNSIKYTEKGYVEVGYEVLQVSKKLQFYVRDSGIGIASDKLEIIFDRFSRVDNDVTMAAGGFGLGLAICKNLVELLKGKIWVESEEGKGSTFYFTIPFEEINAIYERPTVSIERKLDLDLSNFHILIAEDEDINFELLEVALDTTKAKISRAKNGREAVELVNKGNFNVILMDIKMPIMSGLEATRIIKQSKNIPIIAQTACAMDEDKQKCFEAGCDDYLPKPIGLNALFQSISKCCKELKSV